MRNISSLIEKKSVQVTFFLLFACSLSAFLRYENIWDLVNYHYYAGFSFLTGRTGYDIAPAIHHSYLNPLLDSVTYLLIRALNDKPALYYFIMGAPFGLCLFVFMRICLLFFDFSEPEGKKYVGFCLLIAATGYAFFFQIGSSTHEITIALLVLTALHILLKAVFFTQKTVYLPFLLAGFVFGATAGLKISALLYCTVSGAGLILFFKKLPRPVAQISLFAFGGLSGFLITEGFWAYTLYDLFQNPTAPFYNKIFKSPYFEDYNYSITTFSSGRSFWDILFLPFSFVFYSGSEKTELSTFTEYRWVFAFILFFIVTGNFVFSKKKPTLSPLSFVVLFVFLSYSLWAFFLPVMRYSITFEMLLAILFVKSYQLFSLDDVFVKNTISIAILGILVSSVFLSGPQWPRNTANKVLDFEELNLPDKSLLFFVGDPMSAFFVPEAERKDVRAVTVSALTPIAFRFTETGKLSQEREQIVRAHKGPETALIRTDFFKMWKMPPIAWKILEQSDCRPFKHTIYNTEFLRCTPKQGEKYQLFDDAEQK